jgi:hypothetical protein
MSMRHRNRLVAGTGISAVLVASVIEAVSGGIGQSASPNVQPVANPPLTQDQAITSGYIAYQHTVNADGSQTDSYRVKNGPLITSIAPPPDFVPLSASDADLAKYGFPPRPSGGAELQAWTGAMAAWKSAPTPKMTFRGLQSTAAGISDPADKEFTINPNGNPAGWIGYEDSANYQEYIGSSAHFSAPNLGAPCNGFADYPAIWTGLGGQYSQQLMQNGITADRFQSEPTIWQPFWEIGNSSKLWPPIQLLGSNGAISINPLDVIYSKTSYNPTTDVANFFVEDASQGQSTSQQFTTNGLTGDPRSYYDGSTSDFEMEFSSAFYAPFSEYAFADAYSQNSGGWNTLASYSTNELYVAQANPGPIGSDGASFGVGYNHC